MSEHIGKTIEFAGVSFERDVLGWYYEKANAGGYKTRYYLIRAVENGDEFISHLLSRAETAEADMRNLAAKVAVLMDSNAIAEKTIAHQNQMLRGGDETELTNAVERADNYESECGELRTRAETAERERDEIKDTANMRFGMLECARNSGNEWKERALKAEAERDALRAQLEASTQPLEFTAEEREKFWKDYTEATGSSWQCMGEALDALCAGRRVAKPAPAPEQPAPGPTGLRASSVVFDEVPVRQDRREKVIELATAVFIHRPEMNMPNAVRHAEKFLAAADAYRKG